MKRTAITITVVIIGVILYGIFILWCIKDSSRCDEHVILNDKTEYDCRTVSSFSNGMSSIKFCDGTEMTVPTNRIIQVTKIK